MADGAGAPGRDVADGGGDPDGPVMRRPGWDQPPAALWDRIAAEAVGPWAGSPAGEARVGGGRRHGVRRALAWGLGAAAAIAMIVAAAVVPIGGLEHDEPVATAALERLGHTGSGHAELVVDDGQMRLEVVLRGIEAENGFVEIWMIDPEVSKLVSLGPVRPDGSYALPAGLDPRQVPIVDVSVEPLDGNPGHAGDSRLRGRLQF